LTDLSPNADIARQQREIHAQAAVWITDLHGPDRNPDLEAAVRRWIAEDPRHAAAFELATDAWQRSGNPPLSLIAASGTTSATGSPSRRSAARVGYPLAGAAALALTLAATFYALADPTLSTGAGEQKTIDLADGTQVTLNANTRLTVNFTAATRTLTFDKGEALFTVAHDTKRPFAVIVGHRKVLALGTSFDVRRDDRRSDDFTVTLIDGRIAVESATAPLVTPISITAPNGTLLIPGQRLRVTEHAPNVLDSPPIEKVTAWQRGQLIFDDTSLRAAADEFNRYGKRRIVISPHVSDTIRVGGVFRLSDPHSFAAAMANAHRLRIIETSDEITLNPP
jgi:transmembrane sensor